MRRAVKGFIGRENVLGETLGSYVFGDKCFRHKYIDQKNVWLIFTHLKFMCRSSTIPNLKNQRQIITQSRQKLQKDRTNDAHK